MLQVFHACITSLDLLLRSHLIILVRYRANIVVSGWIVCLDVARRAVNRMILLFNLKLHYVLRFLVSILSGTLRLLIIPTGNTSSDMLFGVLDGIFHSQL